MIRKGTGITALAAAWAIALGAGCSSNPPCEADLAAVDSARRAAAEAEAKLAAAQREKQELQEQIAAETARRTELEQRKLELEAKIAELSK
jgi:hypothetical protein